MRFIAGSTRIGRSSILIEQRETAQEPPTPGAALSSHSVQLESSTRQLDVKRWIVLWNVERVDEAQMRWKLLSILRYAETHHWKSDLSH